MLDSRRDRGTETCLAETRIGDRYELLEQVGQGGMATVWRARDLKLKRVVAVKVLHPHLASREEARKRFEREAEACAKLRHPGIVQVYDYATGSAAESYLVTEFIQGVTLARFLAQHGPLLPETGALIGLRVAEALAHAHQMGIVHRDIKPDNLMIDTSGVIKLMDFGIAQAVDFEQMTATGTILGSPAHMSPEQIEGHRLDVRSDVFSFGTLLYLIVTGRLPFSAPNPQALFRQILESRFEPPESASPACGKALGRVIVRCLAQVPAERYQTMDAVVTDLAAYLDGLGLEPSDKHTTEALGDPAAFDATWRPKIVTALLASADASVTENRLARAIDLLNRAMALAPDHPGAAERLHGLTARARRRRRMERALRSAAGALAFAALLVGIFVGVRALREELAPAPGDADPIAVAPPAPPEATPIAVSPAAPIPAPLPPTAPDAGATPQVFPDAGAVAADPIDVRGDKAEPRRADRSGRRSSQNAGPIEHTPPKPPGPGFVDFAIGSYPPNATIYVDGARFSPPNGGFGRQGLTIGKHKVRCEWEPSICADCKRVVELTVDVKPLEEGKPRVIPKCFGKPPVRPR